MEGELLAVGLTNEKPQQTNHQLIQYEIGFESFDTEQGKKGFSAFFNDAAAQIDQKLSKGENVLVYCQQGKDRSAAFLAHYLLKKTGLDPNTYREHVYNFIREIRVLAQDDAGMPKTYFGLMQEALYPKVATEGGGGGSKES
jgi:protein-tyrosine phosphatase